MPRHYRILNHPLTRMLAAAVISGALVACASPPASPTPTGMKVSSSAYADGGVIPVEHGGNSGTCGGQNVSLPVAWSNLPPKARSVAVLVLDPDGAGGLGVSQWVAYNIDAARGQLKSGEAQVTGPGFTVGVNAAGIEAYRGMCPPVGDVPHHYVLTVIASDLAPVALPVGLDRNALLAALKGHALGGQSVVGRYGR
ncbi:MAG: YbhB/YbcL family Raf kinase inhibitor-like protein [Rhodoferax sp.]